MDKPKIGISVGDINGIGLEVIIKFLRNQDIYKKSIPILYANSKLFSYHKNIVGDIDINYHQVTSPSVATDQQVNIVKCWDENVQIELGKVTETGGKYAKISLDRATVDLVAGEIDALVTAPIHKKSMNLAGFQYPGHTEYFEDQFDEKRSMMMMVSDSVRIGLITNHLPLADVTSHITRELIQDKVEIMEKSLRQDFGVEKPIIGVLSVDPHAGDEGIMGTLDQEMIRPTIVEIKKKGSYVFGPFPADGFFGSSGYKKYDGILAMYHDQGLVPFKLLSFGSGVNYTAGLPIIRTSVDHGTGFDIVGKNLADEGSFRNAYFTALDIVRQRAENRAYSPKEVSEEAS